MPVTFATAESFYGKAIAGRSVIETFTLRQAAKQGRLGKLPQASAPKKDAIKVLVNHGRWLVECPCGSAQYASCDDARFLCSQCWNEDVGGRWKAVVWPKDPEAIEAALSGRPIPNRNWIPSETVDDLHEDNRRRGERP